MGHGGKRDGSGRPISKGTLLKQKMRESLIILAHKRATEISTALFDLALGHYKESEIKDETGKVVGIRVYKKSPNGESLAYLLDQVIDKAKQFVAFDGHVETEEKLTSETVSAIKQAITYALPKEAKPKKGIKNLKAGN